MVDTRPTFDRRRFVAECRAALVEADPYTAMRDVVASAVANPIGVLRSLGEPRLAGVEPLYRGDDLTVLNVAWGPRMTVPPQDHRMWSITGVYIGCEEVALYRRGRRGLVHFATKRVNTSNVLPLSASVVHAVTNPLEQITGALRVYGGDFFATSSSEWDPATLEEHPYDVEHLMQAFDAANERLRSRDDSC